MSCTFLKIQKYTFLSTLRLAGIAKKLILRQIYVKGGICAQNLLSIVFLNLVTVQKESDLTLQFGDIHENVFYFSFK